MVLSPNRDLLHLIVFLTKNFYTFSNCQRFFWEKKKAFSASRNHMKHKRIMGIECIMTIYKINQVICMNIFMTFKNKKTNLIFSLLQNRNAIPFIAWIQKPFVYALLWVVEHKLSMIFSSLSLFSLSSFHLSLSLSPHHYINPPWYHLSYIHSILSSPEPLVLSLSRSSLQPSFILSLTPCLLSN